MPLFPAPQPNPLERVPLETAIGGSTTAVGIVSALASASTLGEQGSTTESSAVSPPITERYEIRRELARGGMGIVYEAWDRRLLRAVALKMLLSGEMEPARFFLEAQLTGRIDDSGVVPVFDFGRDARGRSYYTMRLVSGIRLDDAFRHVWNDTPGWSVARVLRALENVARTVGRAHSCGIIHRDLKPSNIMIEGSDGRARAQISGAFELPGDRTFVIDWGLAKDLSRDDTEWVEGESPIPTPRSIANEANESNGAASGLTRAGSVVGTAPFMAPEQAASADVTRAADIYSLGAILYTLLTGRTPYSDSQGDSPNDVADRLRAAPPTPVREIHAKAPRDLTRICERAMARRPEDRYSNLDAFAADLRRCARRRERSAAAILPAARSLARSASVLTAERIVRPAWRASRRFAGAAAAALLVIGALVAAIWCTDTPERGDTTAKQSIGTSSGEALSSAPSQPVEPQEPDRVLTVEKLTVRAERALAPASARSRTVTTRIEFATEAACDRNSDLTPLLCIGWSRVRPVLDSGTTISVRKTSADDTRRDRYHRERSKRDRESPRIARPISGRLSGSS